MITAFDHRGQQDEWAAIEAKSVFSKLSKLLYGYNHKVFLRRYEMAYLPGAGPEQYISESVGPTAVVGGSCPVTGQEVLAHVRE